MNKLFVKKNSDYVNKGDVIFQIFSDNYDNIIISEKMVKESYMINNKYLILRTGRDIYTVSIMDLNVNLTNLFYELV